MMPLYLRTIPTGTDTLGGSEPLFVPTTIKLILQVYSFCTRFLLQSPTRIHYRYLLYISVMLQLISYTPSILSRYHNTQSKQ